MGSLLRAIDAVQAEAKACEGDERSGLQILARALEAPTRTIADNSGYDDGVVVDKMRASTGNTGFGAARRELFGPPGAAACPSVGASGTMFGAPACVYGFFMYLAIAAIAAIALLRRRTAA